MFTNTYSVRMGGWGDKGEAKRTCSWFVRTDIVDYSSVTLNITKLVVTSVATVCSRTYADTAVLLTMTHITTF